MYLSWVTHRNAHTALSAMTAISISSTLFNIYARAFGLVKMSVMKLELYFFRKSSSSLQGTSKREMRDREVMSPQEDTVELSEPWLMLAHQLSHTNQLQ